MTKNEKQLISAIEEIMRRKRLTDGEPKDMYTITKRSNRDYIAEARVGHHCYAAKGKDIRDVIKNLIKELK